MFSSLDNTTLINGPAKKKKKEKEPMLLFSQKKNRDIQEISMWKEFWSS